MNIKLKNKWLRGLRSGEYTQGKGYLRNIKDNSFCCLGVLCDIQGRRWHKMPITGAWAIGSGTQIDVGGPMNRKLRRDVGGDDTTLSILIDMNDHDKSFKQIANYIEENL